MNTLDMEEEPVQPRDTTVHVPTPPTARYEGNFTIAKHGRNY